MAVVRNRKESHYVSIRNETLEDYRLSWAARGMLAYLLTKPPHWEVRVKQLQREGPTGRDGVYAILRELENAGYIEREEIRDSGKIKGIAYVVKETPSVDSPCTEKPYTAEPCTDQPYTANPYPSKDSGVVSTEGSKKLSRATPGYTVAPTVRLDSAQAAPWDIDSREPVLAYIPLKGGEEWPVTKSVVDEYREAFPELPVARTLLAIAQWNRDNPARRKTKRGIKAHVTRWMNKERSNGQRAGAPGEKPASGGATAEERAREQMERQYREWYGAEGQ